MHAFPAMQPLRSCFSPVLMGAVLSQRSAQSPSPPGAPWPCFLPLGMDPPERLSSPVTCCPESFPMEPRLHLSASTQITQSRCAGRGPGSVALVTAPPLWLGRVLLHNLEAAQPSQALPTPCQPAPQPSPQVLRPWTTPLPREPRPHGHLAPAPWSSGGFTSSLLPQITIVLCSFLRRHRSFSLHFPLAPPKALRSSPSFLKQTQTPKVPFQLLCLSALSLSLCGWRKASLQPPLCLPWMPRQGPLPGLLCLPWLRGLAPPLTLDPLLCLWQSPSRLRALHSR